MQKTIWIKKVKNLDNEIVNFFSNLKENSSDKILIKNVFDFKNYYEIDIIRKKVIRLPLFNQSEQKKLEIQINSKLHFYPKKKLILFYSNKNEMTCLINWLSTTSSIHLEDYIININLLIKQLQKNNINYKVKNVYINGFETSKKIIGHFNVFDFNNNEMDLIKKYIEKIISITLFAYKEGYEESGLIINRYGGVQFLRKTELRNKILNIIIGGLD